jgi:hypothetical protein
MVPKPLNARDGDVEYRHWEFVKRSRVSLCISLFSSPDESVVSAKPIPGAAPSPSLEAHKVDSYLPQRLNCFDGKRKSFALDEYPNRQ